MSCKIGVVCNTKVTLVTTGSQLTLLQEVLVGGAMPSLKKQPSKMQRTPGTPAWAVPPREFLELCDPKTPYVSQLKVNVAESVC